MQGNSRDYTLILLEFKKLLKAQKITHQELARRSEIPISTLKKVLSGFDCSTIRLIKMMESVDVNFVNFVASLNQKQEEDVFSLTKDQEEFFAQNLDYFLFFHKMFRDFYSAKLFKEKWNIPDKKYWKILRKLEDFKLIEIMPGENIKFLVSGGLNYIPGGQLQNVILQTISRGFSEFLLSDNVDLNSLRDQNSAPPLQAYMRIYFGKVHSTTYQKFLDGLKSIHQDFVGSCIKDRKTLKREELVDVTWNFGLANLNGMNFLLKN